MNGFEDFFLSPVSDEHYARRMRLLRDNFRFFKLKYGVVAEKIAARNFRIMFSGGS